jgi:renalase
MNANTKPNIAVIGAGVAGLSCALRLESAGANVSVFEKSRGVSGRMGTKRHPSICTEINLTGADWQSDHGTQYFIATDNDFKIEVARWCNLGAAGTWSPRAALIGFDESPAASNAKSSAGESAIEFVKTKTRFVGIPRMTSPAGKLASELRQPVTLKTTISTITYSNSGWRLSALEHELNHGQFDALVLAVPAPQAVALLLTSGEPTREMHRHISRVSMQPCWTVMLNFSRPFITSFDAAVIATGPLRWIARDSSKPGRTNAETWVLQAGPEWSAEHIDDAPDAVIALLCAAFSKAIGAMRPIKPSQAAAHRWRYASVAENAPTAASRWYGEQLIGVCGDWVDGGGVQAAWHSGQRIAKLIADDMLR